MTDDLDDFDLDDIENMNVERVRDFLAKSIRKGMEGLVFNDEDSRRSIREAITTITDNLVRRVIEQRASEISVHVDVDDAGRMVATLSGPKDLLGGLIPGRVKGTRRLTVVGGEVADEKCATLKATRRYLASSKDIESEVEVIVRIEDHRSEHGGVIFRIVEGGVTGWESFFVTDRNLRATCLDGWNACAGTRGRWDSLFIPPDQMRLAFDQWGMLPREGWT
jgi:hypothetical protein